MITFSDTLYNRIRFLIEILLPALIALYGVIDLTLAIGYAAPVATIGGGITVFLTTLLRGSRRGYIPPTDGELVVEQNANESGQVLATLENLSAEALASRKTVTLNVSQLGSQ